MNYRSLVAWQRAVDLAEKIYTLTATFPSTEKYGLVSQMRRSARSVAANIAEGYGRGRIGDYRRHLSFANGSLLELETDLELVVRVRLISAAQADECIRLAQETGRILAGLRRRLKENVANSRGPDA